MRFTDAQFAQALAEPIDAIGRSDFEERLLAFLGRLVRHDMRTMTRYSRFTKPDYLVHSEDYPKPMVERYLKDYYRFDPFFLYWQKHERPGVVWLGEVSSEAVKQGRYLREFLIESGISDEVGVFLPPFGRASVALFLERRSGRFSGAERARLKRIYPIAAGLYKAHVGAILGAEGRDGGAGLALPAARPLLVTDRSGTAVFANRAWRKLARQEGAALKRALAAPVAAESGQVEMSDGRVLHRERLDAGFRLAPGGSLWSVEVLDTAAEPALPRDPAAFFGAELTPRERDIVSLILQGYPTLTIAQRLGLSRGTVKNHRRRIYDKLDITTERELFLSYIERMTGGAES